MRTVRLLSVGLLITCVRLGASDATTRISKELSVQLQTWNRGDIPSFVETYAYNCTFVGREILHGRTQLLARYRKSYASPAAMGKLSFSNVTVKQLDDQVAIATGNWHIDRSARAGGPVGGVFSLVWQLQNGNWRIVLDHTA
jgi:uncharacterized protein (TIGR02246 family)